MRRQQQRGEGEEGEQWLGISDGCKKGGGERKRSVRILGTTPPKKTMILGYITNI